MCVYYYHVIITFCYKVSDLRTKNSNCLRILLVI